MTDLAYQKVNPKDELPNACVIWLHGLGASSDDFLPVVPKLKLAKGLAVRFVFPQAPVMPVTLTLNMVMPAWYDIYGLSLNSRQDETGIRAAQMWITALIDQQIDDGIHSENIVLAGFSQGGAVALHTGLRYRQKLAGVLALSTYLPIADFLEEEKSAENYGLPVFVAHGTEDAVLPIIAAEMTCKYLRDLDYQVEERIYPIAHELCLAEIQDISAWLNRVLHVPPLMERDS